MRQPWLDLAIPEELQGTNRGCNMRQVNWIALEFFMELDLAPDAAIWLRDQLVEAVGDSEYVDNIRYAPADDPVRMADYQVRKEHGCCGYYDETVEHPVYGRWCIGFNYGH